MFNLKNDVQPLRLLCPTAMVSIHFHKTGKETISPYLEYEVEYPPNGITPEEHDALFPKIKDIYKDRLIERYSQHTGHFSVYLKYPVNPQSN